MKLNSFKPSPTTTYAAVHSSVVDSLFDVAPIVPWASVFSPCFVMYQFVSFLVLLLS